MNKVNKYECTVQELNLFSLEIQYCSKNVDSFQEGRSRVTSFCLKSVLFYFTTTGRNKRNKSRAIAGRTARCRCKFPYVSNFTTVLCGFSATAQISCTHQRPFKC